MSSHISNKSSKGNCISCEHSFCLCNFPTTTKRSSILRTCGFDKWTIGANTRWCCKCQALTEGLEWCSTSEEEDVVESTSTHADENICEYTVTNVVDPTIYYI